MTKWQITTLSGLVYTLLLAGSALAQGGTLVAAEFGIAGRRVDVNSTGALDDPQRNLAV